MIFKSESNFIIFFKVFLATEGRADREGCYDPEKVPKFMATKYVAITTEASFEETLVLSQRTSRVKSSGLCHTEPRCLSFTVNAVVSNF